MHIFQVSEFIAYFNDAVRSFMNEQQMAIEGEIAEFKVSQGKFAWFKLKDAEGIIDCFAMTFVLKVPVEEGMKVRVSGFPKIYQRSGKFSINVTHLELVGEGALKRAFELMKKKLAEEGLFAPERKRPLPRYPERIGLITSAEAAAYTDFLRILNNRWGGLEIKLANVAVQGRDAVAEIVGAFRWFNAHADEFDVLVLTRGGGAMEDLAAFNDEAVARAIFSSKIPVVVGVGHERDETIADYVADVRASTPSNAAERLVPERREALYTLAVQPRVMLHALERTLGNGNRRLVQAVDRMETAVRRESRGVADAIHSFALAGARFEDVIRGRSQRVTALERLLHSLDPKAVLKRGYAIVRGPKGRVVTDPAAVDAGDRLRIQLASGALRVVVEDGDRSQGALPI